jgi:hypothetical protein
MEDLIQEIVIDDQIQENGMDDQDQQDEMEDLILLILLNLFIIFDVSIYKNNNLSYSHFVRIVLTSLYS